MSARDGVRSGGEGGDLGVGGSEAMPGRLIMDQHGVTASKKDRSQAQEGQLPQKRDFAQMQTSQANGSHA